MYNRIFIFALCVLCCFVGCKTSETKGTDFSAANRDENIFIDGDDTDIMPSDQSEGSAGARDFSDDDTDSSGKGPDDEDGFESSGDDDEGSGFDPTVGKPPKTSRLSTPPPTTTHPKTTLPEETTTTPKSEPTKPSEIDLNVVPDTPAKTTTTERPRVKTPNTEDNSLAPGGPVGRTEERPTSFFSQPGILAAVIGGAVVGLLCAILLVMFIVYRMRKKDEDMP